MATPAPFDAQRVRGDGPERIDLRDLERGRSLSLCADRGAELTGLRVREESDWHELLYRGNDWRPTEGWQGRAPWLWPVAGRCYADSQRLDHHGDCTYRLANRVHPMPAHGFIRSRPWQNGPPAVTADGASLCMTYRNSDEDAAVFPFEFALALKAVLDADGMMLRFTCESSVKNAESMPFTFGCHLTLDLRSWWGSDWLNGRVYGLGEQAWTTDARMQPADPVALPPAPQLRDETLRSTLALASPGRSVRMESPCGQRRLSILFQADSPDDHDALWVTYRDPQDRFFCCEPWIGWPNGINTGRGRVNLPPGERWSLTLRLRAETKDAGPQTSVAADRPSTPSLFPKNLDSQKPKE